VFVTGGSAGAERAPRRRGRPRRAATRNAIVDATIELLAERGFQAATIEAIATRAGVGRNTIYRRWPAKEELFADALRALTADLDVHEAEDVYSRLLEWIREFAQVFADPVFGRILPAVLGELQANPAFAAAYTDRVVRPRREALLELLVRARDAGELRREADVDHVADLLAGAPFLRLLPLGLPPVTETYAEELLETIWQGVRPAG
jgi:AcrR family transcriptional regulator